MLDDGLVYLGYCGVGRRLWVLMSSVMLLGRLRDSPSRLAVSFLRKRAEAPSIQAMTNEMALTWATRCGICGLNE